jgi:hemolysin-activating ACP:hemolysin acyltransferase
MRSQVRQTFGQVVMALMGLPRYRHQSIMDLSQLVLEPLVRDRIAIAHSKSDEGELNDIAGMAIWASVSEEVDARIREQIKAGVFPIKLRAEDWNSGDINWLLDVLASDSKTTGAVIANFKQVIKEGDLRLHPIITRLVDEEMLSKMTRKPADAPTQ